MSKSAKAALCMVVIALACLEQELKPEEMFESIAASARSYLRDTTELPLKVATTTTEYDVAGKRRKTRRDSHRFTIVQARPDEYRADTDVSPGVYIFHHGRMLEEIHADHSAVAAGMLLFPGNRQNFDYRISRPGTNPVLRMRYQSNLPCAFQITARHLHMSDWCGSGEYAVEPGSCALQGFTFEAASTPAPVLEGRRLKSYRVEESFQTITVPGVAKPFVVPKTITTTYEDEKGKTVLTSEFALLPPEAGKKDSK